MSFERKIGFDPSNRDHRSILSYYNVPFVFNDLKKLLPSAYKEPEPKLLVREGDFKAIRKLLSETAANSLFIPGQIYPDKFPLTSVLYDSAYDTTGQIIPFSTSPNSQYGFIPTGIMRELGRSGRLRFETDPKTSEVVSSDFNEKSSMETSAVIGGLPNRDEWECALFKGEDFTEGYARFQNECRIKNHPALAPLIPFKYLQTTGGYITARTEIGFAIKDPNHPVMFVFEGCEDIFHTLTCDMTGTTAEICEFEFEIKQFIGEPPHFARTPEGLRLYILSFMREAQIFIHEKIPKSQINSLSKAEIASKHVLTGIYNAEAAPLISPDHYNYAMGRHLPDALIDAKGTINQIGGKLHVQKLRLNRIWKPPALETLGMGSEIIGQRGRSQRAPVMA